MTETERTYRTDGGSQDRIINFPATRIREIPATIKRIVTTDEGKIQIVLEGAVTNNEELEKVRDPVMVQQTPVTVDIVGLQGDDGPVSAIMQTDPAREAALRWLAVKPVFLDTETTDLDNAAEICEIAVIDHHGRTLLDTLLKPRRAIPQAATDVYSITLYDGDTLRAVCGGEKVKIRLHCIDAPEMAQKPWGRESRDHLRRLAPRGSGVQIRQVDRDSYGRLVGEVLNTAGDNLNLQMVLAGGAAVYRRYCADDRYFQVQGVAKAARSGIWASSGLHQMPWKYLHRSCPEHYLGYARRPKDTGGR